MTKSAVMRSSSRSSIARALYDAIPSAGEASLVAGSALLTVLAFPDFDLWFLAWISLAPLLIVVARTQSALRAFVAGWLWAVIFFYGTCWWLTYPMIHYAHISAWLAYPLLVLPVALVAIFPGLFSAALIRLIARFGFAALFIAPLMWVSLEWVRYMITGQVWNALGYSQAFHPVLIQSARWGGVYGVSFLIVSTNSVLAYALIRGGVRAIGASFGALTLTAVIITGAYKVPHGGFAGFSIESVVAVQPNVPMEGVDDPVIMKSLLNQHVELSVRG